MSAPCEPPNHRMHGDLWQAALPQVRTLQRWGADPSGLKYFSHRRELSNSAAFSLGEVLALRKMAPDGAEHSEPQPLASITTLILAEALRVAKASGWDEGGWLLLDLACSLLLLLRGQGCSLKAALGTCEIAKNALRAALAEAEDADEPDELLAHCREAIGRQLVRRGIPGALLKRSTSHATARKEELGDTRASSVRVAAQASSADALELQHELHALLAETVDAAESAEDVRSACEQRACCETVDRFCGSIFPKTWKGL